MNYKLTQSYIYADYAGYTPLYRAMKYSRSFIIPTPNRSNSSTGDGLIEDLTNSLTNIFHAQNYEIYYGNSNTDISNKLAIACEGWNSCTASALEHHSSYVPWLNQSIKYNKNFHFSDLIEDEVKFNAPSDVFLINYISNITGQSNVHTIEELKKQYPESLVIVDGAQCAGNIPNLSKLNCDVFYFSSQKLYLPESLGMVFISKKINHRFPTIFWGGGNIQIADHKSFESYSNYRFVGTPPMRTLHFIINNLSVFRYKDRLPWEDIMQKISLTNKWPIIHSHVKRVKSIYSFDTYPHHPHDIGDFLLKHRIIARVGNLCCSHFFSTHRPVLRLSFGMQTSLKDVQRIYDVLEDYLKQHNHY